MTGFLRGRWEGGGLGPGRQREGPPLGLPCPVPRALASRMAPPLSGAGSVLVTWGPPPKAAPPQADPDPASLAPAPPRQVRDLRLPVPAARVAQLAHEEAHGRGAVQLHVRALREALREAGQRQVPHAQKPPRPQASLTHPTTDRPYLFVHSDTTPGLAGAQTAAGASRTAGRKEAPLLCPGAGPPPTPPYLWRWRLGLHCQNCVKRAERH